MCILWSHSVAEEDASTFNEPAFGEEEDQANAIAASAARFYLTCVSSNDERWRDHKFLLGMLENSSPQILVMHMHVLV